jgi:nickel transport protein
MRLILLLLSSIISIKPIWAHGVIYHIEKGQAIIIKASYDNGEPISFAEVKIYSPQDKKIEYQIGRTDANGYFAFLPGSSGMWKIILSDGIGHGFVTTVFVEEGLKANSIRSGLPCWQKLIVGISLFVGLTAILFSFKGRK